MSTLADDLDDEEIEASLLWTDDEDGDHDNIDPLDEELLLSEPICGIESTSKKEDALRTNQIVLKSADVDKNSFEITKLVESEQPVVVSSKSLLNEDSTRLDYMKSNNLNICDVTKTPVQESLETTLTEEFIDLNVTINTRDALESTLVDDNTACLNETVCEEPNSKPNDGRYEGVIIHVEPEETTHEGSPANSQPNETVFEEKSVTSEPNQIAVDESNVNPEQIIVDANQNCDCSSVPVLSVSSSECHPSGDPALDVIHVTTSENSSVQGNQISYSEDNQKSLSEPKVQANIRENENTQNCTVDGLEEELGGSKAEESSHLTVIDCFETSSLAEMTSSQSKTDINAAAANPRDSSNDDKHGIIDYHDAAKSTSPIDDAIKIIRQEVAKTKRAASLSDEQEPALKRLRHSSEPVTVGNVVVNKESKPVENKKSSTPVALSPDSQESEIKKGINEVAKKKSIVTFDFQHYCKEASTNPFVCKTCSMKFKEELKFESHLIAHHAMLLNISHFNIDLHQYYRQKKEKAIAQSKSVLPKLEGIVDQALIKEYNQNVKILTAQKNVQYFCKICENIYSTKNLIIEHLKCPKHMILRKKV